MQRDGERIFNFRKQMQRRKSLRNQGTSAEAVLWSMLRSSQLMGRKFRRQHGIENFIVDFYCASEQLVIELDGAIHSDPARAEYDLARQERLTELGFRMLRFENKMIFQEPEAVLASIAAVFRLVV